MSVKELNKDQLTSLKQTFLDEVLMMSENRNISYGEMASIDEIVSDEDVFEAYEGTFFVPEDFACAACQ
jgi:hypothetical protein